MGLQIVHDVHGETMEERDEPFQGYSRLETGDIVYVPMTRMACAERYFGCDTDAFRPIIALESTIILGGNAVGVLKGESEPIGTAIYPNP